MLKLGRRVAYFDNILHSGEVCKIVNDKHHIVYEDGDKEEMDHDQLCCDASSHESEIA